MPSGIIIVVMGLACVFWWSQGLSCWQPFFLQQQQQRRAVPCHARGHYYYIHTDLGFLGWQVQQQWGSPVTRAHTHTHLLLSNTHKQMIVVWEPKIKSKEARCMKPGQNKQITFNTQPRSNFNWLHRVCVRKQQTIFLLWFCKLNYCCPWFESIFFYFFLIFWLILLVHLLSFLPLGVSGGSSILFITLGFHVVEFFFLKKLPFRVLGIKNNQRIGQHWY